MLSYYPKLAFWFCNWKGLPFSFPFPSLFLFSPSSYKQALSKEKEAKIQDFESGIYEMNWFPSFAFLPYSVFYSWPRNIQPSGKINKQYLQHTLNTLRTFRKSCTGKCRGNLRFGCLLSTRISQDVSLTVRCLTRNFPFVLWREERYSLVETTQRIRGAYLGLA